MSIAEVALIAFAVIVGVAVLGGLITWFLESLASSFKD
jgi:Flp pilus assembly pilin Flp